MNDINITTTTSTPAFNIEQAADTVRNLIKEDERERENFLKKAQENSKRISIAISDFHQEMMLVKEAQIAILTDLYEKELIRASTPAKAKILFDENPEMATIKYLTSFQTNRGWKYNKSFNNRAPISRQLAKLKLQGDAAYEHLCNFTIPLNEDGSKYLKGPQAVIEKDRRDRGVDTERRTKLLSASTDISRYFDDNGNFAQLTADYCSAANIEDGVFGEFVLLLGRVSADGSLKLDRAINEEETTQKLVMRYKADADEWKQKSGQSDKDTRKTDKEGVSSTDAATAFSALFTVDNAA